MTILAGVGAAGLAAYHYRHRALAVAQPVPSTEVVVSALPSATPTASPTPTASATPTPAPTPLPASLFIQHVPYTPQAPVDAQHPGGNWDAVHEEYCEAAAVVMIGRYYRGDRFAGDNIPAADADSAMAQVADYERRAYPGQLDLPLSAIGSVGQKVYNMQPVVGPATLDNVKRALAQGRPVVIPVMTHGGPAGAKIAPFYGSVSVYHVIVITGYDGTKVYTNDAGFIQGHNYAYDWSLLETAMDAQATKMGQGRVMLTYTPGS